MEINWKQAANDSNDCTAIIGQDMLRVERLDVGVWWFAIYISGMEDMMSGLQFPHQRTKNDAKMLAEAIYKLIKK